MGCGQQPTPMTHAMGCGQHPTPMTHAMGSGQEVDTLSIGIFYSEDIGYRVFQDSMQNKTNEWEVYVY